MNANEIRGVVLQVLNDIAPGIEESALQSDRPLRSQVNLDSMDWLNCLVALGQRLHLEIPESDYAKLGTLDALVSYLAGRLK
jgi:acyl carrier protein